MQVPKLTTLACAAIALFLPGTAAWAATCDRGCLLQHAKQFNAAMLGHAPEKIQLAPAAQVRENTKAVTLSASKWTGVTKILSEGVYADPTLGNVIEHVTAQTAEGKSVYIGTRLKVVDGKIREVEINFDDSDKVNVKNLVPMTRSLTPLRHLMSARPASSWNASSLPTSKD